MARPDKEPSFLRRPQAVPRKRRPALLRVLLLAALGLAAGVGLLRFAASSRFALTRYDVSGNTRARTEEILVALAAWKGKNLVALDLEPLASRLGRHPWIERVTLAKRFPDGLAVRVTERRALALYRDGESFSWVGADGRLIAPYDSRIDRTDLRDPERGSAHAARGRRSARGSAARATRVLRGALGNRLAPGRWIRYDGCDLSKAGSRSSGRCPGEGSRAARGAQFREESRVGGTGHRSSFCRSRHPRRRLWRRESSLMIPVRTSTHFSRCGTR